MRVLLGPLNPRDHRAVVGDLAGLDVQTFDRVAADIALDPARESFEHLWSRLPAGWIPDLLIWWSPEYSLLPEGIERCPVPSVAVLGDWNLGFWTTAPLLEAFDWVVTDRKGVAVLGPQLDVPVDFWPAFSFDRALHRREPAVPRDIDVLFVGNMNHEIQAERAPWLARVARLSERYHVRLASGVYGEAYAGLLRRARIVWNRSIRGEMNMRAYEAPAAGALLFLEAENLEVRDVFSDGVSCVLYDADTLESRLAHYLDRPDTLARLADAGWRRVQSETYGDHVARLLAAARGLRIGPRPFAALPAWRRDYWLALHALCSPDSARVSAALGHFARAAGRTDDQAALAAALGAAAAMAAHTGLGDREEALAQAAQLLALGLAGHRDDVVTCANLGWVQALRGERASARATWLAARGLLRQQRAFPVDRAPLPVTFDRFRVEWERAALAPDLEGRVAAFRPLLAARIAAALADLDAARAIDWWAESVAAAPGVDRNVHRLAVALQEGGHVEAAADAYARLLDCNPFDGDARAAALDLARQRGDVTSLAALAADQARLAAALATDCDHVVAAPVGA